MSHLLEGKALGCLRVASLNPLSAMSHDVTRLDYAEAYATACVIYGERQVYRKMQELARRGYVDYNVSPRICWLTIKGRQALAQADERERRQSRGRKTIQDFFSSADRVPALGIDRIVVHKREQLDFIPDYEPVEVEGVFGPQTVIKPTALLGIPVFVDVTLPVDTVEFRDGNRVVKRLRLP